MDLHPLPDVNEKSNACPQVFANLWSPILYFSFDFYSDTNQDLPPFQLPTALDYIKIFIHLLFFNAEQLVSFHAKPWRPHLSYHKPGIC